MRTLRKQEYQTVYDEAVDAAIRGGCDTAQADRIAMERMMFAAAKDITNYRDGKNGGASNAT